MNGMFKTKTAGKHASPNGGASRINPLSVAAVAALFLASLLSAQAVLTGHWEAEVTGDGSHAT